MKRQDVYLLLSFFADGKEHSYTEVFLGLVTLFKRRALPLLRRALEYEWVVRTFKSSCFADDTFILSPKGDSCFRDLSISYGGDYRHYRYFKRK